MRQRTDAVHLRGGVVLGDAGARLGVQQLLGELDEHAVFLRSWPIRNRLETLDNGYGAFLFEATAFLPFRA